MRNPQFMFSLTDPDPYDAKTRCPVVISLAQKVTQRKQEHAIGFRIYKVSRTFSLILYLKISNKRVFTTKHYIL